MKKTPEPVGCFTLLIGWMAVAMVIGYILEIVTKILLQHWVIILILTLITIAGIVAYVFVRRRDRWY